MQTLEQGPKSPNVPTQSVPIVKLRDAVRVVPASGKRNARGGMKRLQRPLTLPSNTDGALFSGNQQCAPSHVMAHAVLEALLSKGHALGQGS
jgi:hypothetical protein